MVRQQLLKVPGVQPAVETVYGRVHQYRTRRWVRTLRERDRRTIEALAGRRDLRLNVGSSSQHLDGWLSLDIRPSDDCLMMDATKPWPFAADSAEAVNSEHFIEHLTLDQARLYLAEAYRVLKPGGLIRTSTPSLRGLCAILVEADPQQLEVHRSHGYTAATHGEMFNNYFFSWGHQHIYDFETLARLLGDAGFVDVEEAAFGHSRHALLHGIDRHDPGELQRSVLCVDAVKPA